jgi:hypothetical protein
MLPNPIPPKDGSFGILPPLILAVAIPLASVNDGLVIAPPLSVLKLTLVPVGREPPIESATVAVTVPTAGFDVPTPGKLFFDICIAKLFIDGPVILKSTGGDEIVEDPLLNEATTRAVPYRLPDFNVVVTFPVASV